MEAALPRIERRLADLIAFAVATVTDRSDPRIKTLESQLDNLLVTMFGADTVEYDRYKYRIATLDRAPLSSMGPMPIDEVREGLQDGKNSAISQLEGIKSGFAEELELAGRTSGGRTLKAYEGLELHPIIEKAAGKLFHDGRYANAVEDAVKALNIFVKLNSGVDDKDGTSLMEFVFRQKSPLLRFNELKDDSDRDEQKGFMMMFSGAVAGLRNPRAHKIIKDDPEKALEFIAFVSLLAKLVETSTKA